MKKKIFSFVFAFVVAIGLLAGMSVTASAKLLSPNMPAGFDKGGQYPAGKVDKVYYYSKETKSNRKLVVYTPPGYSKDKKYPVIYAIHGINNTPESIFADWGSKANTLADNLIGQGKIQPVIIVAFDNNDINSHNELFNNVMPFVESTYPIIRDADHRGIYGYSMGGGVAMAEGMANLDTFHHVCPTSQTPFNHPSDKAMFTETAKKKIKTLVLSCGTKDWCGFYNANKASHDYCDAVGFDHYWMSVPGGNHDSGVWAPAMYYFLELAFPSNGSTVQPPVEDKPAVTVPGETAKIADGYYYIKNMNAQKYLQVAGNTGKAGQNVELAAGTGKDGQKWYVKNLGNGYITLKSALGDFMIDIAYGKNEDGANAGIYNGYSGEAQQFMLKTTNTKDTYVIATKCSSLTKVLDDEKNSTAEGANVCQWTFNGKANQQWAFEAVGSSKPETKPEVKPETPEAGTPAKLKLDYTTSNWGTAYQVNFKVTNNTSADVNTWTLKVKKSDINITSSWSINVKEAGDYYVITPVEWNSKIAKGASVEFGIQGSGSLGNITNYTLN